MTKLPYYVWLAMAIFTAAGVVWSAFSGPFAYWHIVTVFLCLLMASAWKSEDRCIEDIDIDEIDWEDE